MTTDIDGELPTFLGRNGGGIDQLPHFPGIDDGLWGFDEQIHLERVLDASDVHGFFTSRLSGLSGYFVINKVNEK
jgi:hypothetical protein